MRKKMVTTAIRQIQEVGKNSSNITIYLGVPSKVKANEWKCPFLLDGFEKPRIQFGRGVDGLQALLVAIEGIRVTLERSGKHFSWLGGEDGDLGLPQFIPTVFGAEFSNKMGQLVEKEMSKFVLKARSKKPARKRSSVNSSS
jgi:hypothetical protein